MNNPKTNDKPATTQRPHQPLRFLSPIHKATRQLSLHLERRHCGLAISHPEAHMLAYLLSYGPCSIAKLLRVFGFKKSTLTSILDRLVTRGFTSREVCPTDRRSFMIGLTSTGRTIAAEIRRQVEELEAEITRLVGPRHIAGFERVMQAIATITAVEVRDQQPPTTPETPRSSAANRGQRAFSPGTSSGSDHAGSENPEPKHRKGNR